MTLSAEGEKYLEWRNSKPRGALSAEDRNELGRRAVLEAGERLRADHLAAEERVKAARNPADVAADPTPEEAAELAAAQSAYDEQRARWAAAAQAKGRAAKALAEPSRHDWQGITTDAERTTALVTARRESRIADAAFMREQELLGEAMAAWNAAERRIGAAREARRRAVQRAEAQARAKAERGGLLDSLRAAIRRS